MSDCIYVLEFDSLPHKIDLNYPKEEGLENTVGKGENAGYQHFLLFPQCFLRIKERNYHFNSIYFVVCKLISIWTSLKFCCLVKS